MAFSAYGSVTKLNGWPMEQARVVARSSGSGEEQRVEEAVVDQDGLFRIRGLTPGLKYVLTVESEQVKRSVPNTITIDVKQQDTKPGIAPIVPGLGETAHEVFHALGVPNGIADVVT